jgi:hypothetical protein
MKAFSFLQELWSITLLFASSSRAGELVANLGESVMSQSDVNADENVCHSHFTSIKGLFIGGI